MTDKEQAFRFGLRAGGAARERDTARARFEREAFRKWAVIQRTMFAVLYDEYTSGYRAAAQTT